MGGQFTGVVSVLAASPFGSGVVILLYLYDHSLGYDYWLWKPTVLSLFTSSYL